MNVNSEQSFFCVLEDMKDGVLVIGSKGIVVYCNEQAREMMKLDDEPVSIVSKIQENPENDEFLDYILDAVFKKERHLVNEKVNYVNPEGRRYVFRLTASYMKSAENTGGEIIITLSDITELEAIRKKSKDHVIILTILMSALCIWNLVYSIWDAIGQPISSQTLTKGVEFIGILALIFMLNKTSLSIRDMGIGFDSIKEVMKRAGIISLCMCGSMILAKVILVRYFPSMFSLSASFFDFQRVGFQLLIYVYTAFIQEFISRGLVQESLNHVFSGKYKDFLAIGITSLLFAALHIHKGVIMCIGSGVLSVILGVLYKKDKCIWGLVLVHYTFGIVPDLLGVVS